jgi:hypothetical protein
VGPLANLSHLGKVLNCPTKDLNILLVDILLNMDQYVCFAC